MNRAWICLCGWSMLSFGCRFVASLDGLEGTNPATTTSHGGSAGQGGLGGGAGIGGAGAGGGNAGGSAGRDGGDDRDGDAAAIGDRVGDSPGDSNTSGPFVLYRAGDAGRSIRGITVYADNLYWVEVGAGLGLLRMPKVGGGRTLIHTTTLAAFDIAVDGNFIYYSDESQILQLPISADTMTSAISYFSPGSQMPRYVTVDDRATVYVTNNEPNIANIVSGTLGQSFVRYQDQPGVAGIAFYQPAGAAALHDLLWGYATGIKEGSTAGSGSGKDLSVGGSTDPVQGVATDGRFMYWISGGRVNKSDPSNVNTPVNLCFDSVQDLGADADIAVDDGSVYVTYPNRNEIWKCPKN